MKASMKSLLLLVAGVILLGIGLYDILMPVDDDVIMMGGEDNSYVFYIIIGLTLGFAGVMGFIRESQKQNSRRKDF